MITASWLFLLPVFEEARLGVWAALLALGVVAAVWALKDAETDVPLTVLRLIGVSALLAFVLLPFPYNVGPALLAAGLALLSRGRRASRVGAGVAVAGAIVCVQTGAAAVYYWLAPRLAGAGVLAGIAQWLLRLVGARVAVTSEGLLLDSGLTTITYGTGWDMFGLLAALLLIAGAVVVLVVSERSLWDVAKLVACVVAGAVIRYVLLTLMFYAGADLRVFWSAWSDLAVVLLLGVMLSGVIPVRPAKRISISGAVTRNRTFWVATACAIAAAVTFTGAVGFEDPGTHKAGRVLMEEGHSDWESTARVYDTEWYGEQSGYNYYNLYEYLDLFYEMGRSTDPLSDELLAEYDVLIIKTPTTPFAQEEIESIVRFVEQGGGLFLVGEHTNVFGTSTNLNPLAEKFGLHFDYDATYELDTGALSEYDPPRLLPHPVVQHLPRFLFATSCSMRVLPGADAVITGYGLKALDADYSQESFFPTIHATPDMDFGLFLQAATAERGDGRVASFTDSTVFSNFWMFMPGKPELVLSYVDWLNRQGSSWPMTLGLVAFGVVLAAASLWLLRQSGARTVVLVLVVGVLLGVPLGLRAWEAANRAFYPLPEARCDYVEVAFEQEYSDFYIPSTLEGFTADRVQSLHTFYVWTQRLGYVPSASLTLEETMNRDGILVIINPVGKPSERELTELESFVSAGGRLLVLDSAKNESSTANEFLESFGLGFGETAMETPTECDVPGEEGTLTLSETAIPVEGGEVLVLTSSGESVCSRSRWGDGEVVAWGDSSLFFDASMGSVNSVPDARRAAIYEFEFAIMRLLGEKQEFSTVD